MKFAAKPIRKDVMTYYNECPINNRLINRSPIRRINTPVVLMSIAALFILLLGDLLQARPATDAGAQSSAEEKRRVVISELLAYKLKALLLGRLPKHLEWPVESGVGDPASPFVISVIGTNPFDKWLENTYPRRKIKDKPVKLRYINEVVEIRDTNLLFIGETSRKKLTQILDYTQDKAILTVSETAGYGKRGVHINILEESPGFALEVNESALRRSGLMVLKSMYSNRVEIIDKYDPEKEKAQKLLEILRTKVQWPAGADMVTLTKDFKFYILGSTPMQKALENVFSNQQVLEKRVRIYTISAVEGFNDGHVLFISGTQAGSLDKIIDTVSSKSVLTVSDTYGFAESGVHLNFYFDRIKLKTELNLATALETGLTFLPDLIKNSRKVRNRRRTTR